MHPGNIWGGPLEITGPDSIEEKERSRNQLQDWDKASFNYQQKYNHLDETRRSWLLRPPEKKKKKHIDLGCIVCSTKVTLFLASLFADYMTAAGVPGWYCGSTFMSLYKLKAFARSQIDYILGKNPLGMSYVVGYGPKYPKRVHHRAASIPNNHVKYSCSDGWKWANTKNPNPNIINGAMVGGPDKFDKFLDVRQNFSYTEATMAGNAALTAALMSLTTSPGIGVDENIMFSFVPPLYPPSPPPPRPWKP